MISLYKYYNLGPLESFDKIKILALSFAFDTTVLFVEKPWRLNYSKSKKYLSIVALISVLGFCYLIIIQNGYVNRLNENEKLFNKLKTTAQDEYCTLKKAYLGTY